MSQSEAHIRITLDIWEAIMLRDFSKRQRKILDLILRLSWGCGRSEAIIPRRRDFEIVGLSETKIKIELEWLIHSKVIFVNGDRYSFNSEFDEWQVSRVMPFHPEKVSELVSLNLDKLAELGSSGRNNFPKRETKTSRKGKLPTSDLASPIISDIDKGVITNTPLFPPLTSPVTGIFDFWNTKQIIVHRKLTNEMKRTISAKLKDYSAIELCKAIANYAEIVNGQDYFWNHRWTLQEFLTRKSAVERFLDGDVARENYRIKAGYHGTDRGHTEKPKQPSPFASFQPIISGPEEDGEGDMPELRK